MQWDDLPGTAKETYTVIQDGVEYGSDISTTTKLVDNLSSNSEYAFQVQASNSVGDSEVSDQKILATGKFLFIV